LLWGFFSLSRKISQKNVLIPSFQRLFQTYSIVEVWLCLNILSFCLCGLYIFIIFMKLALLHPSNVSEFSSLRVFDKRVLQENQEVVTQCIFLIFHSISIFFLFNTLLDFFLFYRTD